MRVIKICRLFLYMFAVFLVGSCREHKVDAMLSEPTVFPVEAWVVTAKETYRPGEIVDLKLRIKNRAKHTIRLPVPVVCVNGSGWGELRLDLFVNGRKFSAECHTPDVIEIESGSEVSWPIRSRRLGIPIGKPPWNTQDHFTVYAVWQRVGYSAQKENDFLGPLVSHTAEFDILVPDAE